MTNSTNTKTILIDQISKIKGVNGIGKKKIGYVIHTETEKSAQMVRAKLAELNLAENIEVTVVGKIRPL